MSECVKTLSKDGQYMITMSKYYPSIANIGIVNGGYRGVRMTTYGATNHISCKLDEKAIALGLPRHHTRSTADPGLRPQSGIGV